MARLCTQRWHYQGKPFRIIVAPESERGKDRLAAIITDLQKTISPAYFKERRRRPETVLLENRLNTLRDHGQIDDWMVFTGSPGKIEVTLRVADEIRLAQFAIPLG